MSGVLNKLPVTISTFKVLVPAVVGPFVTLFGEPQRGQFMELRINKA
jgi:hypothetical protein